jgi:ubiquinone/menaquinone biosynthesis C-methylase UbiE
LERAKAVSRTFDEFCDEYDAWYSSGEGELIGKSELLAIKKLSPKGKGLEVGVGSGFFASRLDVEFGVDPAESCLRKARSRGVKVALGAGENLPFRENSLDFVVYSVALCFLTDPGVALEEARRVLKPRGKVIACFISRDGPWGKFYTEKKEGGHRFYKHARLLTPDEVEGLLEQAGFRVESVWSTLFQGPGGVSRVEAPVEGKHDLAGFCCIRAEKV